jgi:aminodeoxyfutalosine deaminase
MSQTTESIAEEPVFPGGSHRLDFGPGVTRLDVAGIVGPRGLSIAPASMLLGQARDQKLRVIARGRPTDIDHHPDAVLAKRISWPHAVVLPGLVNAHAHLDLTHIGPRNYDANRGFVGWVEMVRTLRLNNAEEILGSVRRGAELSLAGGTVAIADIAGAVDGRPNPTAARALVDSSLWGASFIEFFALPKPGEFAARRLDDLFAPLLTEMRTHAGGPVRVGLQPHAPYSVGPEGYVWACRIASELGVGISTHLAENATEVELIARGTGPLRDFLEGLGRWNSAVAELFGRGCSPVEHLLSALAKRPMLAAHGHALSDADIERLGRARTTIVYCPRASEYFGAQLELGPHRYRDLLAAGVPVALGTDSIIGLPPSEAVGRISILDEMRCLHARDAVSPSILLDMATVHGGRALGIDDSAFSLDAGSHPLGLVAVGVDPSARSGENPLERVLRTNSPPHLIYIRPRRAANKA